MSFTTSCTQDVDAFLCRLTDSCREKLLSKSKAQIHPSEGLRPRVQVPNAVVCMGFGYIIAVVTGTGQVSIESL